VWTSTRQTAMAVYALSEYLERTGELNPDMTLTFHADREYEWLMVEDPIPAGFEPIREYWGWWGWEWSYWYSSKEFHDDRVTITMNRLEPGVHTASYTMRAETPGDFRALPARAFNMYFPDLGAHTAEGRLKIRD